MTWLVGAALVSFVAVILFLVREFINAPLCDDDGNCIP